jgi:hypothetical protein
MKNESSWALTTGTERDNFAGNRFYSWSVWNVYSLGQQAERSRSMFFSRSRPRNRWQTLSACLPLALGIAGLIIFSPPEKAKEIKVSRFIEIARQDGGIYQVGDHEYIPCIPESKNVPVYLLLQPDYPSTQLKQEVREKPKLLKRPKKKSMVISIRKKVMELHMNGIACVNF